jgi:hypothetical protein
LQQAWVLALLNHPQGVAALQQALLLHFLQEHSSNPAVHQVMLPQLLHTLLLLRHALLLGQLRGHLCSHLLAKLLQ